MNYSALSEIYTESFDAIVDIKLKDAGPDRRAGAITARIRTIVIYPAFRLALSFNRMIFMDAYLSMVILWSGDTIPDGWAPCDGQEIKIPDNEPLYALINNTYGGDGHSTFKLPDLRDSAPAAGKKGLRYIICTAGIFPR